MIRHYRILVLMRPRSSHIRTRHSWPARIWALLLLARRTATFVTVMAAADLFARRGLLVGHDVLLSHRLLDSHDEVLACVIGSTYADDTMRVFVKK